MEKINHSYRKIDEPKVIDFTVKMHYVHSCKCSKFRRIRKKAIEEEKTIIFDRSLSIYRPNDPPMYFCTEGDTCEIVKKFGESMYYREIIYEYFKCYSSGTSRMIPDYEKRLKCMDIGISISDYIPEWDPMTACLVRNITKHLPSANLCATDSSRSSSFGQNGGCILIGNKMKLETIARTFNERVTKTEFTEIKVINVRDMTTFDENIGQCVKSYYQNISNFIDEYDDIYILIGKSNGFDNYKLSFGKREWFGKNMECSRQCAFRELFEEFNIQINHNILEASKKQLENMNIPDIFTWKYGGLFHNVYISKNVSVKYNEYADTIGLGY